METMIDTGNESQDVLQTDELKNGTPGNYKIAKAVSELEQGVYAALETYSNVHRGSGHNSMVTTHLYEQARDIVLDYMGLNKSNYVVIFCTPRRVEILKAQLGSDSYQMLSSQDFGLPIGVRVLAVRKKALPKGIPFQTGGGTAKLMSKTWVIWDDVPDKFEAGTPSIINVIAFAKALLLIKEYGEYIFTDSIIEKKSVGEILYNDELEKYSGQELLNELKKTMIGIGVCVPTMRGVKPFINLDNAASTPTFEPIWNVFQKTLHLSVKVQQDIIREVRTICAGFLNAPPSDYDVIFTSNTTEAINLTTESLGRESEKDIEPVVLNTLLEHSSNDLPWRMVPNHSLIRLSVDDEGFFDLNELETLLCSYNRNYLYGKKRITLVAVSGASNVLGVCNNISEISQIVHRYGAHLLVDAAQLIAHRKIDMEGSNIDYLAFSAHKAYAPFGCGVLVVRKGTLNFNSSEMELIQSFGEENAGGIAALGKALLILKRIGMDSIQEEERALTMRLLHGMEQIKGIKIYGIKNPESKEFEHKLGVIAFSLGNIMPSRIAKELALRGGIGIRYGCHCAHILVKRILNIGSSLERFQWLMQTLLPGVRLPGVARVSIGIENNGEDVDSLIQSLKEIAGHVALTNNGTQNISQTDAKKQIKDFVKASALRIYSKP